VSVAIAGFLGFAYGLPSDGGRWAWSDTSYGDTLLSQTLILLADVRNISLRTLVGPHVLVPLFIGAGWLLAHAAIASANSLRRAMLLQAAVKSRVAFDVVRMSDRSEHRPRK